MKAPGVHRTFLLISALILLWGGLPAQAGTWQDAQYNHTLQNSTLQAKFQAGHLYELTDLGESNVLLSKTPNQLDSILCLFGSTSVNLDAATAVNQTVTADSIVTNYSWADGTTWNISWSLDGEDLVLNTSANSPQPVGGIYINLTGCKMTDYSVTATDAYGVCHTMTAPYIGAF